MVARREVPGITIDNLGTKDRDDAIWLEWQPGGGALVYVSIADVAAHVGLGGDVDKEARRRGFSRYFATRTVYMLPRNVTLQTCSLDAAVARDTITVKVPVSADLQTGQPEIIISTLRSSAQLSYGEADLLAEQDDQPLAEMLRYGFDLSSRLLQQRREKGALAVYDLRNGWYTDEDGELVRYESDEQHRSHVLIQELMILANRVLAEEAVKRDLPQIFRNHQARNAAPPQQELAADIQEALSLPGLHSLANLQQRIRLVVGRANYGTVLLGHYGLSLPAYGHYTSPIRRYADLVNWRMWRAHLLGLPLPYSLDELAEIADEMTAIQESMRPAQREQRHQALAAQHDVRSARQALLDRPADDLHKLLKLRCQEGVLDPQLEEAVLIRLGLDTIRPKSLFYILEAKGDAFDRLKHEVWQKLDRQPGQAANLWEIINTEAGLRPMVTSYSAEDGRKFWSASIIRDGQVLQSPLAGDHTLKGARHKALLWLLRMYYGQEVSVGDISADNVSQEFDLRLAMSQQPKLVGNPKQELLELCQRCKLAVPSYQSDKLGEQHRPIFSTQVTVRVNGHEYRGSGLGANKKLSEQQASLDLLQQLNEVAALDLTDEPQRVDVTNYVGMLMELSSSHGWTPPSFELQRSGGADHLPEFRCLARLYLPERIIEQSATAPSKQEAKRLAAMAVYQALQHD